VGATPQGAALLKNLWGTCSSMPGDTIVASAVPTTSMITVNSASRYTSGRPIGVMYGSVNSVAWTTISSINGAVGGVLYLNPTLVTTPTVGNSITGSISYTLATTTTPQYVSLWVKQGHTVFACKDAAVEKMDAKVTGDGQLQGTFSGGFGSVVRTGTDATSMSFNTSVTSFFVRDPKKFDNGSIIKIEAEIIAVGGVDYATGMLFNCTRAYKSTSAASHAEGIQILPWIPTPTAVGSPLKNYLGKSKIDSSDFPVTDFNFSLERSLFWLNEEKDGTSQAAGFAEPSKRTVTSDATIYYRQREKGYIYDMINQVNHSIKVPVGDVTGNIMLFCLPQVDLVAEPAGGDLRTLKLTFKPYASSAYDDEASLHLL